MKRFIVFNRGIFIDVERIVCVAPVEYPFSGSVVYIDQTGFAGGESDQSSKLCVTESPDEVRALIQKALSKDVSFVSAQ